MHVGQNQFIQEFTFMDSRGVGKWDMMSLKQTEKDFRTFDHNEAGVAGLNDIPPPNITGAIKNLETGVLI